MHPGDHIRRGGADDLDRLEPLWVSVHHRHVESMPELAPYVDDATTWAVRRALYAELLAKPDTILLRIPGDASTAPWHARLALSGPARVCGP